jgi:PAS domain S-box/DNA binding domain, excisionase family
MGIPHRLGRFAASPGRRWAGAGQIRKTTESIEVSGGSVNLKQAAGQLGVHYQTAYKWVRSGDLTAIRVGGRYEVSDAAITQFQSSRTAAPGESPPFQQLPPPDLTTEDGLEELEALAMEPFLSVHAIAAFAARRGAEIVGDLCLVVRFDGPDRPELCAVSHSDPGRTVSVVSAMDVSDGDLRTSHGMAYTAYSEQRVVRVAHVPQDQLRKSIRPELRQHLARYPVHSLLAAPILVAGNPAGAIVLTRDTPNHPYSEVDEDLVVRMCTRIGALIESALDVELAWTTRRRLVAALRESPDPRDGDPTRSLDELQHLVEECSVDGLPVSILDAKLRFLAVNPAFLGAMGYPLDAVRGKSFESFIHPADRAFEQATFDRLTSGELDYLDIRSRRLLADGTDIAYASHRAAVRDPSATLRSIVTVARPLHIPKADYSAVIAGRANSG